MTQVIATVAASLGANLIAFRSTTVAAENKGDVTARSLIASMLVDSTFTADLATAAIIHAFGNPKGAKGKAIEKLSGLRNVTGGDAVRKMATSVFSIVANIDADKTTTGDIRKIVTAFVLNEKGASKSLRALVADVGGAIRAHVKATQPDNSEAEKDNEQADADATADAAPSLTLTDRAMQLAVAFEAASEAERLEAAPAFEMLFDLYNQDAVADEPVIAQAA